MPGDADPGVRADALYSAASLAMPRGDLERASVLAEESLTLARAHGDRFRAARALNILAIAPEFSGDFARAAALYAEGLHSSTGSAPSPRWQGANVANLPPGGCSPVAR